MSKEYHYPISQSDCSHFNAIEDEREGIITCPDCSRVLDILYSSSTIERPIKENLKFEDHIISELIERGIFPPNIYSKTQYLYTKLFNRLKLKRFKDIEILVFCLYETLNKESIPRTPLELCNWFQINPNKIWQIEKELQMESAEINPIDFVERFCAELELKYFHCSKIKEKLMTMYGCMDSCRPQGIATSAIYSYCKENNIPITLKKICSTCNVSTSNVLNIIKKMNKK